MSTVTEMPHGGEHNHHQPGLEQNLKDLKLESHSGSGGVHQSPSQNGVGANGTGSAAHPLHTYDLGIMSKFYESCSGKMSEQNERFKPSEWHANSQPMPQHMSWEDKYNWSNPLVLSQKQRVYEAFARMARESGEPMVLMPNFDFGDMLNFEKFLESLKLDGINAIGKYKQYLSSRDIRKLEIDLVAVHPRYGILLCEVKESDHFDNKKRNRARIQLNSARSSFEALLRLVLESKGLKPSECHIPITQLVALPNVREMPAQPQPFGSGRNGQGAPAPANGGEPNTSTASIGSSGSSSGGSRPSRTMKYLIKSDLENTHEFGQWWHRTVVQPMNEFEQQQQQPQPEEKLKKPELLNMMLGLVSCVRNNSILPVVYPETGAEHGEICTEKKEQTHQGEQHHHEHHHEHQQPKSEGGEHQQSPQPQTENGAAVAAESKQQHFQPALNVYAEFFRPQHEEARALSKVVVVSRDLERIRKTICLQTLWLLLNDSQKKISVVCSEMNKPYYEEFFARQRKVYNNLNNLRFYTDIHSCDPSQHTLKRDGETWFFDCGVNGSLSDICSRVKDLNSFWIFSDQPEKVNEMSGELNALNARYCHLDEERAREQHALYQEGAARIKLPLRLQCDLLIVGDLIGLSQLKFLYKYLKNNSVPNYSNAYQHGHHQNNGHHQQQHQQQQYQQLKFNPSKKFRTIKFIRGGSIDNLRTSLKMHDSIQAPVVFMHVGDEDLFKTRYSVATIERIKELATLMKEYCPKSFVCLSTLMRRMSRTENQLSNEVNKGIMGFCKQTRDTVNCHYMLNNHFEPDYHTQGRLLNNKGLKLFADNILFVVDYFLIRSNKQQ